MQPLLATLTRLLVAGGLGIFTLLVFQSGIDSLFILMACGLVLYGLVMVVVMRRELGVVGMPLSPAPGQEPPGPGEELVGVLSGAVAH